MHHLHRSDNSCVLLFSVPYPLFYHNISDCKDRLFIALIAAFQATDDTQKVQEIFTQLLNFDNDNVLDLPLMYVKDMVVYNTDKIAGYTFTSTPMFFDINNLQPVQ